MKVYIAEEAGFCFGVKRALRLISQLHQQKKEIRIYGQLIHNDIVLKDLEKKGIFCIHNLNELNPQQKLVTRTHGISVKIEKHLKKKKVEFIDATCPLVKKSHNIIQRLSHKNVLTIVVGDKNHPEIIAAKSYSQNAEVINSIDEARNIGPQKHIAVIAQTTLSTDFFKKIISILTEKTEKLEIFNTICQAAKVRQKAIKKLAPEVDFVVVIGGKNSSNTKKLYDLALEKNKNTFYLENSSVLRNNSFAQKIKHFKTVGISAGASTPPEEIEKVKQFFEKFC